MTAVIQTGGKQYVVAEGDVIEVEKLDNKIGDKLTFDAMFVSNDGKIKTNKTAEAVKVTAEVVEQGRNEKVIVFTYRAKKKTKRKYGHRQPYTSIKIVEIK